MRGIIRRGKGIFVFALLLIALSGCGWLYQGHQEGSPNPDISNAELVIPAFEYVNQYDEQIGKEDLEGTKWLTMMVFTRCPSVCGLMVPNMVNLQERIKEEGLDVKIVGDDQKFFEFSW